jgi:hypothetical protein
MNYMFFPLSCLVVIAVSGFCTQTHAFILPANRTPLEQRFHLRTTPDIQKAKWYAATGLGLLIMRDSSKKMIQQNLKSPHTLKASAILLPVVGYGASIIGLPIAALGCSWHCLKDIGNQSPR